MSTTIISGRPRSYRDLCDNFQWQVPEYYNIGVDICDRHVLDKKDSVALLFVDESGLKCNFTFRQIAELSNRLANALVGLGCGAGDRVAILLPQTPENGISHVAIYKLGAIAVPMSTLFGPDAIEWRLRDSGARAIITDTKGREKLAQIQGILPDLKHTFVVGARYATEDILFAAALEQASPKFVPAPTRAEDPALIIYTSGTTGPPKGVLHAHRVLLGHLPGFELSHDFFPQQGDLFWTPADWAWAGGLLDSLLPTWHYGYPILAFKFARKFDPERALWLMAEFNVRNVFLPPAALKMMKQVLPSQQSRTIRLRTVMSGGEALGPQVFQWALAKLGVSINEIFGQTEANYVVGNCREIMPIKPASMGRPYPGHSVRLLNERGSPVGKGELGEIAVRSDSPVVFLRYWNNGVATGNKFRDGWLLTGDLAVEDDDGYLFFNGRVDDIIGSSGYRIGPTEIEECLLRHPSVALAAVIGVPDEARGMVVKAFIQLANGYSPSDGLATAIQGYVKNQFAAYAYPRLIEFIDEIPTTTTGKIRRDELRRREGCSSGS